MVGAGVEKASFEGLREGSQLDVREVTWEEGEGGQGTNRPRTVEFGERLDDAASDRQEGPVGAVKEDEVSTMKREGPADKGETNLMNATIGRINAELT